MSIYFLKIHVLDMTHSTVRYRVPVPRYRYAHVHFIPSVFRFIKDARLDIIIQPRHHDICKIRFSDYQSFQRATDLTCTSLLFANFDGGTICGSAILFCAPPICLTCFRKAIKS